mmetsp:Transcript_53745/g.114715  ORF Transcript_53745/g.114715 Transcript_53745/m.114715 type:complete len:452 (+) Transcript_53745:83-1438(+)
MTAYQNPMEQSCGTWLANERPGAASRLHTDGTIGHHIPFPPTFGNFRLPEWSDPHPSEHPIGPPGWLDRRPMGPHMTEVHGDQEISFPLALPPGLAGDLEPVPPQPPLDGQSSIPAPSCLPTTMLDPYSSSVPPPLPPFEDLSFKRTSGMEDLLMSLDPTLLAEALRAATSALPPPSGIWSVDTPPLPGPLTHELSPHLQLEGPPSTHFGLGSFGHQQQLGSPEWIASKVPTPAGVPKVGQSLAALFPAAPGADAPSAAGAPPSKVIRNIAAAASAETSAPEQKSTMPSANPSKMVSKVPARTASLSTTECSESRESRSAASTPLPEVEDNKVTRTIVMKNLWCKCGPGMLSDILEAAGFGHLHEEIYVPLRTAVSRAPTNRGYGFVTFIDIPARDACLEYFQGREVRFSHSVRKVEVAFAERRTGSRIQRNQSLWPDKPSTPQLLTSEES